MFIWNCNSDFKKFNFKLDNLILFNFLTWIRIMISNLRNILSRSIVLCSFLWFCYCLTCKIKKEKSGMFTWYTRHVAFYTTVDFLVLSSSMSQSFVSHENTSLQTWSKITEHCLKFQRKHEISWQLHPKRWIPSGFKSQSLNPI